MSEIEPPQETSSEPVESSFALRSGVPVFPASDSGIPVTVELVKQLDDAIP